MNPVVLGAGAVAAFAFLKSLGKKSEDAGNGGDGWLDMRANRVTLPLDKAKSLILPGSTVEGAKIQEKMLAVDAHLVNVAFAMAKKWSIFMAVNLSDSSNGTDTMFYFYPQQGTWAATFGSKNGSGGKNVGGGFYLGPVTVWQGTKNAPTGAAGWVTNEKEPGLLDSWKGKGFSFYKIEMTTIAGGTGNKRESMYVLLCPEMKAIHAWTNGTWAINGNSALTTYFIRQDGSRTTGFVDPAADKAFATLNSGYLKSSLLDSIPLNTVIFVVGCVALVAATVATGGSLTPLLVAAGGSIVQAALTNTPPSLEKVAAASGGEMSAAGIGAVTSSLSKDYDKLLPKQKNDFDKIVTDFSKQQGFIS